MKYLLLLAFVACSGMSEGRYRKEFHQTDYSTSKTPAETFELLKVKMTKCYPQSDYPMYEKTVASFNEAKSTGSISYQVDNQSLGPKMKVLVDVLPGAQGSGSLVKIYAKGDLTQSASGYKHDVLKWLEGKKVDCDARGKI